MKPPSGLYLALRPSWKASITHTYYASLENRLRETCLPEGNLSGLPEGDKYGWHVGGAVPRYYYALTNDIAAVCGRLTKMLDMFYTKKLEVVLVGLENR